MPGSKYWVEGEKKNMVSSSGLEGVEL